MSRVSDSLAWGIRWETVERLDGTPLYGALMPETYTTNAPLGSRNDDSR